MQQLLHSLEQYVQSLDIEAFYEAIFAFMTQQSQRIDNYYLAHIYQVLLPSIRRSYFLTLNTSRRELQESLALFRLVIEAILLRKSHQAALFLEDFCRHLRNLVLESLARMKQIELAWARRSRR